MLQTHNIVLLAPNVPGYNNGNNASDHCNSGDPQAHGNCKEISRGCWDGYGQMSKTYHLQSAAHMQVGRQDTTQPSSFV